MDTVNRAISEARRGAAPAARQPAALVAGAIGRRGEALLNAVLARGGYAEVSVLAHQPVSIGTRRLRVYTHDQVPAANDLFMLITDHGDGLGRSFHGRDAAFVDVDESSAVTIAEQAVAAGVRRIVAIVPTSVLLQFGSLRGALSSTLERKLGGLDLQRLVVVRPLRQHNAPGAGFAQKVAHFYLQLQMLMLPRSIEPVTSEQLARAALNALANEQQSLTIVPAAEIATLSRR